MGVLERLGLSDHGEPVEPLLERLETSASRAWRRLREAGRCHPRARAPALSIPPAYLEVLRSALALEEATGGAEAEARAERIRSHYLDMMPAYRVEQLSLGESPNDVLFHGRLVWERLPRLVGGLERVFALLEGAGVPPEQALGVPTLSAFCARYETLAALYADTYFGSFLPFLYAFPGDLRAYERELRAGEDPLAVFDRRLAAPILHELMHFGRDREAVFPPYLDECLAGYLGVLVFPEFAYPAPGEDNALYGSPWFAQVGQALVRACGLNAVVQAQTGYRPVREALPVALVEAAEALGWSQYRASRDVHFLTGNTRPEAWIALFYLAVAGRLPDEVAEATLAAVGFSELPPPPPDPETEWGMLRDALASMCLHNTQDDGAYRVAWAAPAGPVTLDFEAGWCCCESHPDSLDLAPPRYTLPPGLAARYRAAGRARLEVAIDRPEAVERVACEVFAGPGA